MKYGCTGKILEIDLFQEKNKILEINKDFYDHFIGGRGLAGYFYKKYYSNKESIKDYPLIFCNGPAVLSSIPAGCMLTVMSISPLNNALSYDQAGGNFGAYLKSCGWDGLIIIGKSNEWCGISINENGAVFNNAVKFQGIKISDVNTNMYNVSTAVIGTSAENKSVLSNIVFDGAHFVTRGGIGSVFAEKKIKYISVSANKINKVIPDNDIILIRDKIKKKIRNSVILNGEFGISNYGSGSFYDPISFREMMPTANFRKTFFINSRKTNAWHYKKKYKTKHFSCYGCMINCKIQSKSNQIMPEYDAMAHFSALINNDDIELVTRLNSICLDTGMDPVSLAGTIACYLEVNDQTLDKMEIIKLTNDIAHNRNNGKELINGSYAYAIKKGRPDISMSVKKLEIPAWDPRGAYGIALSYAVCGYGADYQQAFTIPYEIFRKPNISDPLTFEGKARFLKDMEILKAITDSLCLCKYLLFVLTLNDLAEILSCLTNENIQRNDLLQIGERIIDNEKSINKEQGLNSEDDILPERFFKQTDFTEEYTKINPINKDDFYEAVENYYKISSK